MTKNKKLSKDSNNVNKILTYKKFMLPFNFDVLWFKESLVSDWIMKWLKKAL